MITKIKYTLSLALVSILLGGCTPAIIDAVNSGNLEKVKKEVDDESNARYA
jgi:hypothetical protein